VHHPRGSEQNPLSDADIEAKLTENTRIGGSGVDAAKVIAAVWALDQAETVAPLARAASSR